MEKVKKKFKILDTKYFGLIIGLFIFVLFLGVNEYTNVFKSIENKLIDVNFKLKNVYTSEESQEGVKQQSASNINPHISQDILIIGIDFQTLTKLGKWPFPRYQEANFLDSFTRISDENNRENSIFLDIFFIEPDEKGYDDVILIDSIKDNGKVFLETVLDEVPPSGEIYDEFFDRQEVLYNNWGKIENIEGDWESINSFYGAQPPLKPYGRALYGYGHANYHEDSDETYRRQPLIAKSSRLLEEFSFSQLSTSTVINKDNFERLEWTDKSGEHHNIEYPITEIGLKELEAELIKNAPQKVETDNSGKEISKEYVIRKYKDSFIPSITLSLACNYFNKNLDDVEVVLGEYIKIKNPLFFDVNVNSWVPYKVLEKPAKYKYHDNVPLKIFAVPSSGEILGLTPKNRLYSIDANNELTLVSKKTKLQLEDDKTYINLNDQRIDLVHASDLFIMEQDDKLTLSEDSFYKTLVKEEVRKVLEEVVIPIDDDGNMLINFMGMPSVADFQSHQTYPVRSFSAYALNPPSKVKETWRPTRAVENKILMVGDFARGIKKKKKPTPYGLMYGVEIHANALNTIIMNKFIHYFPKYVNWIILFVLVFVVSLMTSRLSTIGSLISTIVLIFVFFLTVSIIFENTAYILEYSPTAFAMFITFLSIVVYRVMTEEKDKKRIRNMFGKYVSKGVVDHLLENPPELGGVDKQLTVFFSDVRGFTTLSESMTPQELINHLNIYLTAMTDIILDFKGTLDKYVGDEIMCFWGAPLPQEDHAILACKCALKQMKVLKELNEQWPVEKRINIGIGVNSGIMTVGNVGSEGRMNYTLMGDPVNLGARLEGTNKMYGTNVIISEFTYALVKDKVIVRELDNIRVKGKNKPVLIYELVECLEDYDNVKAEEN